MPDNCECEDRPGTQCSRCFSPDSVTEIVDDDGDALATNEDTFSSPDTCECEDKPGTCCSRCLAPDAITETAEWDPEEMAFAESQDLVRIDLILGGESYSFTFVVYPGEGLPYAYISFETDEDWPDGTVVIYDEDGEPVLPYDLQTLDPDGSTYTAVLDPSFADVNGDYTGNVHVRRTNETETEEDEHDLPVEWTGNDCVDLAIGFWGYGTAMVGFAVPGNEDVASCDFLRACGVDNLYWSLSLDRTPTDEPAWWNDWPAGASYELWNDDTGTQIVEGTVYGPITTDDVIHASIKVNSTDFQAGVTYFGYLTLRGYSDAFGTTQVNVVTKLLKATLSGKREFDVTAGPVGRGIDFNATLEAKYIATGLTDEQYGDYQVIHPGDMQIDLSSQYAPPDEVTPVLISGADITWENGITTLTGLQITGGAGLQYPWLHFLDRLTLTRGSVRLTLATAGPLQNLISIGKPEFIKNGIWNAAWATAYASFEAAAWTSLAAGSPAVPSGTINASYAPNYEVDAYTLRLDTVGQSGKVYTQVDVNVDLFTNSSGTVFRLYALPSTAAAPPSADLDTIRDISASAEIVAGGVQTLTLHPGFIASTYLYIFIV